MHIITVIMILLALIPLVSCECCFARTTIIGDWCGGKGKCNIFCCNCDGGCKPEIVEEKEKMRSIPSDAALDLFETIDSNMDEVISMNEAKQHLLSRGYHSIALDRSGKWFNDMDANKNGFLERHEFDESLSF